MAVYIINNMTIRDPAGYAEYLRGFMRVFRAFEGEVLAVADDPAPMEGTWPHTRTVLLRFPSREAARRWYESPEYEAIAVHRRRATDSNVVVLDGFEPGPRG